MNAVSIRIGELGAPTLFPEINPTMNGDLDAVGILEAGMESGKTSLMLLIKTPKGHVACQLSADMLHSIDGAVRGAEQRFSTKNN